MITINSNPTNTKHFILYSHPCQKWYKIISFCFPLIFILQDSWFNRLQIHMTDTKRFSIRLFIFGLLFCQRQKQTRSISFLESLPELEVLDANYDLPSKLTKVFDCMISITEKFLGLLIFVTQETGHCVGYRQLPAILSASILKQSCYHLLESTRNAKINSLFFLKVNGLEASLAFAVYLIWDCYYINKMFKHHFG